MSKRFIVFEGIDGSGKSTQARMLHHHLRSMGRRAEMVREPGTTPIGEKIRALLLGSAPNMSTATELFLYMAARAQLVRDRILPLLDSGAWVVCDRYVYSSAAYQGEAGGMGMEMVLEIGRAAVGRAIPSRVFVLDLEPSLARRRTAAKKADRIERRGPAYQNLVRRGFLKLAKRLGSRAVVLDAARSSEEIHREILKYLYRASLIPGPRARKARRGL